VAKGPDDLVDEALCKLGSERDPGDLAERAPRELADLTRFTREVRGARKREGVPHQGLADEGRDDAVQRLADGASEEAVGLVSHPNSARSWLILGPRAISSGAHFLSCAKPSRRPIGL
jgi:hypothetical protein